ncbi:MAG: LytR C-terminal domain-containing protein [Bacteroidetes bacterium]|nr:LytR C-terminal domain-containing protein [Bacteroidota bacterium]
MGSRSGNLLLNLALVAVLAIAAILVYSFSQRVTSPRPDARRLENPGGLLGDFIQVEVRNSTGIDGLASEMSQYLSDLGFDVVEVGNFSTPVQETVILDRVGNPDVAEQVALALGVDSTRVREERQPTWFLDASIVIGNDFRKIKPFSARFPQETEATEAQDPE